MADIYATNDGIVLKNIPATSGGSWDAARDATTGQVQPWIYQKLSETFVLDDEMRRRMGEMNPTASLRMANRLLEAHERDYWQPDEATLEGLRRGADELEDKCEGIAFAAE